MISPAQALLTGCIGTLFICALILAIVCIVEAIWSSANADAPRRHRRSRPTGQAAARLDASRFDQLSERN